MESDLLSIWDITTQTLKSSITIQKLSQASMLVVKSEIHKLYIISIYSKNVQEFDFKNDKIIQLTPTKKVILEYNGFNMNYTVQYNKQIHLLSDHEWYNTRHYKFDIDKHNFQNMIQYNPGIIRGSNLRIIHMKQKQLLLCIMNSNQNIWFLDLSKHQPKWEQMHLQAPNNDVRVLIECGYILICLCYDKSIWCFNLLNCIWYQSSETCFDLNLKSRNFIEIDAVTLCYYYHIDENTYYAINLFTLLPLNLRQSMQDIVNGYVKSSYTKRLPQVIIKIICDYFGIQYVSRKKKKKM